MFQKFRIQCAILFLLGLCLQLAFAGLDKKQKGKVKLVVVKLTYDATYDPFTEAERQKISQVFYDSLMQDERIEVITDAIASERLATQGFDPTKLDDEEDYRNAGQFLQAKYVVIGELSKIGKRLDFTFHIFNLVKGNKGEYRSGKTMERFVKEEIPTIIARIRDFIKNEPSELAIAKTPWWKKPLIIIPILAGGGATTYVVVKEITSNDDGPGELPPPPALPRR